MGKTRRAASARWPDGQAAPAGQIPVASPAKGRHNRHMCIVAFAWQAHPRWQMIAIGNRDELHARAADPLSRWGNPGHVLAGRDAVAGGTWLGISEQGRFAVVTNLYGFGEPSPDRASRGGLLNDFLSGSGRYADLDAAHYADFNPFNLITVSGTEARVHANRPGAASRALNPGVHGLSNGPVEQPWPKSPHLNSALEQWMAGDAEEPGMLFDALSDQALHSHQGRPAPVTPSRLEPEHSPVFICNPTYGTRCSTVVAIDNRGMGVILERRFAPSGEPTGETRLDFAWPKVSVREEG
jgi:uncharacterized protein with NRDE domain